MLSGSPGKTGFSIRGSPVRFRKTLGEKVESLFFAWREKERERRRQPGFQKHVAKGLKVQKGLGLVLAISRIWDSQESLLVLGGPLALRRKDWETYKHGKWDVTRVITHLLCNLPREEGGCWRTSRVYKLATE